jgi:hypothetical protein
VLTANSPRDWARRHWLDVVLCATLVAISLPARLVNLDEYTISFPEGIRAQQLLLMSAGYAVCSEIFCNQGPLLFYVLWPPFELFGRTLAAARLGNIALSLVGIVGMYWIGRLLCGRLGGVVAAALLVLSPTYLKFSRLALAEVPAEAPAILAVGGALSFAALGSPRWLSASGVLLAFSLLLKPVTLATAVPIGLLALTRPRHRWRNGALLTVVTAVSIAVPTVLVGFSEIVDQIVFRLQSRVAEGRGPLWNVGRIAEELAHDRLGLVAVASVGFVVALATSGWKGRAVAAWLVASLGLLLVHTPLHGKHMVTLIPPMAALGAIAIDGGFRAWRSSRRLHCLPALLAAIVYVAFIPGVMSRQYQLAVDPEPMENDPPAYWYDDTIRLLGAITAPGEMIVTDHPYLPFAAGRLVPPSLAESSVTRILAHSLTPESAIAETRRYDARAVLLWADKLTRMDRYKRWIDQEFVPVRVWAADDEATPTLYVAPGIRDRAERFLASSTPIGVDASFPGVVLEAAGMPSSPIPRGRSTSVETRWRVTGRAPSDYRMIVSLRQGDQTAWRSGEIPIMGLAPGLPSQADGQRMTMSVLVSPPRGINPGDYAVTVRLWDPRRRQIVEPTEPSTGPDPRGVSLGQLTVR